MFTQFFGNYLLNRGALTAEQLLSALEAMKKTRPRLGVLAINAGYMTAEQVEEANRRQQQVDKRIGDVMIDMGFVTKEQVDELFNTQPAGHLALGQVLIDSWVLTTDMLGEYLAEYKREYGLTDADLADESDDSVRKMIEKYYGLSSTEKSFMSEYIYLLIKNVIRFIGSDFTPLEARGCEGDIANCVIQKINGAKDSAITAVCADDKAFVGFASRFAKEELSANDEYAQACVSEFLNLHNGIYTVNVSNESGEEYVLQPREYAAKRTSDELPNACVIPLQFPFGTVEFILSM